MGVSTQYKFGIYREIKEIRQKNDGGLTKYAFGFNRNKRIWGREIKGVSTKYGFELYREIKEMKQKNDGGLTKYGFGLYEEVKEI